MSKSQKHNGSKKTAGYREEHKKKMDAKKILLIIICIVTAVAFTVLPIASMF